MILSACTIIIFTFSFLMLKLFDSINVTVEQYRSGVAHDLTARPGANRVTTYVS